MGLRNVLALTGFVVCTLCLFVSLIIGYPTAFVSASVWRAWQDLAKGSFGMLIVTFLWFTSPAKLRVYTASEKVKLTVRDGKLSSVFAPRAVVVANHQIYSDWMYMWYLAYTSRLQGSIVVALKKSLKNIPILGWAMQWFRFLFLSRKWEDDRAHIEDTTRFLSADPTWPTWMCLFPEGTVVNPKTWRRSEEYAAKIGASKDLVPKHMLLPRVKGLYTILRGLNGSIPVLYDFTMAYEPVSTSEAAETRYSLKRTFLQGQGPRTVKVHIREFPMSEVPYKESEEVFQQWLYARWAEKDQIYADLVAGNLESEFRTESFVRPNSLTELYQCFNVPLTLIVLTQLLWKFVKRF